MRNKTAKELLAKVKKDYSKISTEFNITRKRDWKEFLTILPFIKNKETLVDLGCGNGRFTEFLKNHKKHVNYIGIDNNKELLGKAKENFGAKFQEGDLLKTGLPSNSVDHIISIAAFHHIPSKKLRIKSLREINRTLKQNGTFSLTVWNLFQPKYKKYIWRSRLKHILSFGKYDSRDTFIPWGKTGVKRYYYAFTKNEIKNLLEKNGFTIVKEKIGRNFLLICKKQ